jgi:type I restriction enzyme S subunit
MQAYIFAYVSSATELLRRACKGSAQQSLNQRALAQFPVLLPAQAALEQFESEVRPLLDRAAANLIQSSTLAALRNTLLPELIRG